MNASNLELYFTSSKGVIQWDWKGENLPGETPSPKYKAYNYQWYVPKKSEFEIVTKLDRQTRQEVKDEIWEDMQLSIEYQKQIYKLHKQMKKESK